MKGWDPSVHTEVQIWMPGLVRTSRLPRTTLSSVEEMGRCHIQKVTPPEGDIPCQNQPPKANRVQIKTSMELPSPWSFRACWLVTRCLEKTLFNNTQSYIFWCFNCVYKITDLSCLVAKMLVWNIQGKGNWKRRRGKEYCYIRYFSPLWGMVDVMTLMVLICYIHFNTQKLIQVQIHQPALL